MYRPELRANTEAGQIEVVAAGSAPATTAPATATPTATNSKPSESKIGK
jgi:hypothetical protein